ncbi:carbohydrate porin [Flammeovirga yaeyamensis]|uniref:Carbohydrate porin n=1 Tax=Flammeovirga yaeyamensis TaxID=367791 RepID=A0AAX1NDK1_9BACT|nr:carbohydrate porin [Flammeovirga yaeyamensis]MBB3696729.1 carbohydrate-selective porin OprB [Flammeovirga yaeyamensis]NMF33399.1 carbohydrate porin [Flammeovirga yaeyamensis]QWG05327.1 carbohydrate porin [Flammeovirga yaeyamensis]
MRQILIISYLLLLPICVFSQTDKTNTKEGYENNDPMGGPKSVGRQLEENNNKYTFEYRYPIRVMKDWYAWKDKINKDHGIKFGINYTGVYLRSSETITSDNNPNAAGGILDLQLGWTLANRKKGKNTGTLYIKMNSRHNYNGKDATSPMFHGIGESGYYGLPAAGYRRYSFRILEFNWQQNFFDNRLAFVVGKVDITNYFNFHGLIIPWQHFMGFGSSVSGTMNWGNQGLGGVVSIRPTEQLYVMFGMVDVYGDQFEDGDFFDVGRYFDQGKYNYLLEVGYVPTFAERYFKKISLTAWNSASYTNLSDNFIGQGQGMAFSSHWFFNERFAPYFRFGFSNGVGENTFYKKDVQIGHGLRFRNYDMLGISISWNEPNIPDVKDQYTAEIFYRFNLSAHFEITPSAQYIRNPTFNPSEDNLFYFGFRGRMTL